MSKEASDEKVENLWFTTRSNITNNALNTAFKLGPVLPPGKIMKNKQRTRNQVVPVPPEETPYFILLVGSPGVGKTTTIKKYIRNELDLPYNVFYHISLDFVVERIKPYRNATKKKYNEVKGKRNNGKLTEENFKNLAKSYSIVQTTSEHFGLNNNASKKKNAKTKSKAKEKSSHPRLYTVVKTGIEKAIENRYHVIYDTTFSDCKKPKNEESKEEREEIAKNSYKKLAEIVSLLEENAQEHPEHKKYKVVVMLVTADQDRIEKQLQGRHENMITEHGFIRAIDLSLVKKFMECNQFGFESARDYYTHGHRKNNNNTKYYHYRPEDFEFIERYNRYDPHHMD